MSDENNISDTQGDNQQEFSENGAGNLAESLTQGETTYITEGEGKKGVNRSTMMFLGLMLAAGGAMYVMYVRGGPQTAEAASSPEAATANETITQFLGGGNDKLKQMEQMLKNTEKVVEQFLKYPSANQVPLADLHTNPFRHQVEKVETPTVKNDRDEKKRKEEERQLAVASVQRLQLQSIMHSSASKACMINNTLYQEGQQIEQFVIEKISADAVVVKTGVYRFELRMQR
jgi:hypothetical protein